MQILEDLAHDDSPRERSRGNEYAVQGRVTLIECSSTRIRSTVRGSSIYRVEIAIEDEERVYFCTCPAFARAFSCKHLWATIAAARERLGFRVESAAPPAPEPVAAEPWRAPLLALEAALPASAKPAQDSTRPVAAIVVRYGLVTAKHEDLCEVAPLVAPASSPTSFQTRAILPRELETLPEEDRRLLATLFGGATIGEFLDDNGVFRTIPTERQAALIPALVRTGRLHLARDTRGANPAAYSRVVDFGPRPLAEDPGGPWTFVIALRQEDDELALRGELRRGHETVGLEECDAILSGGFCVFEGHVARVDWCESQAWAWPMRRHADARLPLSALDDTMRLLDRCPGRATIDAPGLVDVASGAPRGVLQLARVEPRTKLVRGTVSFEYDGRRVASTGGGRFLHDGERWTRVTRHLDVEARLEAEARAAGLQPTPGGEGVEGSFDAANLRSVVEALTRQGWLVEAEGVRLRGSHVPNISVASGIDWFDVDVHVDFDGVRAGLPELLRALQDRDGYVLLSDGSHGLLPEQWLAKAGVLTAFGTSEETSLRVPKAQAWLLSAWLDEQEAESDLAVDEMFTRWRDRLHEGLTPHALHEPESFHGELRPYQREGLGWLDSLSRIGMGGCLADDMGLGKTVQVLAMILARRANARGPALVVAPTSVLFNWLREAERFAPTLDVRVHHGTSRTKSAASLEGADVILTSYGTMRRDVPLLGSMQLDLAVLDEAQSIKNPSSLAAKAARTLRADMRLALTGTPIENHLGDLFSIFQFLEPALVKGSARVRDWMRGAKDDVALAQVVARGLRPFLLRRTKEQVLSDLPAKTEQLVECDMHAAQRRAYDELRRHFRDELLGKESGAFVEPSSMNVLEALLRLRQAACHPGLVDPARSRADSGKLEALLPMLEDVVESGHKGLVFSQFTSFLAIVRERLDERGIVYEYLDGRTKKREEHVRRFQEDPDVRLFLVSLKAGGVGLNLTAADYVFLLDPWWNPAVEAQAIDRSHRIGQTRAVTAYRFVSRGTVEEKVMELQQRKMELARALFDPAGSTLRGLTREDLEWLLS